VTPDQASSLFQHVDKVTITLKRQCKLLGDALSIKEYENDEYEWGSDEDDDVINEVYDDEEDDEFIDEDGYADDWWMRKKKK